MNWRRVKNDRDSKHYKEWRAGRGCYRIVWRDQNFGVEVPRGYQCCVRICVRETGDFMWEFVDRSRRPIYRTLKAAKAACEKHADPNYRPIRKKGRKKRKK